MENKKTANNIFNNSSQTNTTIRLDDWLPPTRISVTEFEDRIEMLYKQVFLQTLSFGNHLSQKERVFKIVYSCVDGKWNKSEPIYGEIIPAKDEYYEF
jgi:hypothetical protein